MHACGGRGDGDGGRAGGRAGGWAAGGGARQEPSRPALDTLVQRMRREKSWRDTTSRSTQPQPGQSYADTVRKGGQNTSPRSPRSNRD